MAPTLLKTYLHRSLYISCGLGDVDASQTVTFCSNAPASPTSIIIQFDQPMKYSTGGGSVDKLGSYELYQAAR